MTKAKEKKTKSKAKKKAPAKKNVGGRPSKLTPAVKNKIVMAVKRGTPLTAAAASAGISSSAVMQWMKWGREGKEGYAGFADAVTRAREAAIDVYVQRVNEAAENDHRAAAWMLARLDPTNFGDPGKRQDRARESRIYEAQVAKLEAEARLASAKALAAEQMAKRLEHGDGALENVVALLDEDDARDVIQAAMRAAERVDSKTDDK